MVRRILKLFHHEFSGLHKTAMLLALSAGASSVLGLFRDRLLAGHFGANRSLDIYYASFKIPDLLYNIIALSLVSVTVLIPMFLEKVRKSNEDAHLFLNGVFTVFLSLMIFLALGLFFFTPYLSRLVAPGFSHQDRESLITLTRIMLLSSILLGLSNLLSSVIQSFRRFFIYALSPIFYNAGIIFGILFLYPIFGMRGLAFGVVLGAFLHAFIQVPGLIRLKFSPRFTRKIDFSDMIKVVKFSLPRSLGLGMQQILLVFITAMASAMAAGSIAVFNFSLNLQSVVLMVVGISYSVAAFPTLAKLFVNNKKKEFLEQTISAARQILFWSFPASILLIVLRAQIVRVILGTGNFTWNDTKLVAASLALFSLSITAQALVVLFVRAFYAAGKTKKPFIINVSSSLVIAVLAVLIVHIFTLYPSVRNIFERILRVNGVGGMDILALTFSFSMGMILNVIILIRSFSRFFEYSVIQKIKRTFIHVVSASILMGATSYLVLIVLGGFLNTKTFIGIFSQGFIAGISGIAVWYYFLIFVGNRELKEITNSIKQKFWKTQTIVPGPRKLEL